MEKNNIPVTSTGDLVITRTITINPTNRTLALVHHLDPKSVLQAQAELTIMEVKSKRGGWHDV